MIIFKGTDRILFSTKSKISTYEISFSSINFVVFVRKIDSICFGYYIFMRIISFQMQLRFASIKLNIVDEKLVHDATRRDSVLQNSS